MNKLYGSSEDKKAIKIQGISIITWLNAKLRVYSCLSAFILGKLICCLKLKERGKN